MELSPVTKRRRRASHPRETLLNNGRRATQLSRFTCGTTDAELNNPIWCMPVFLASRRCKSCSFFDRSFSRLQHPWSWLRSLLIPLRFWELNLVKISSDAFVFFANVLLSWPLLSTSGKSLPNSADKSFSCSLKICCATWFRSHIASKHNHYLEMCIRNNYADNAFPRETRFSHWLEKTRFSRVLIMYLLFIQNISPILIG